METNCTATQGIRSHSPDHFQIAIAYERTRTDDYFSSLPSSVSRESQVFASISFFSRSPRLCFLSPFFTLRAIALTSAPLYFLILWMCFYVLLLYIFCFCSSYFRRLRVFICFFLFLVNRSSASHILVYGTKITKCFVYDFHSV